MKKKETVQKDVNDNGQIYLGRDLSGETVRVSYEVITRAEITTIDDIEDTTPEEWREVQPREYSDRTVYQHDTGPAIETSRRQPGWKVKLYESAHPRATKRDDWTCNDHTTVEQWFEDHIGGNPHIVRNK